MPNLRSYAKVHQTIPVGRPAGRGEWEIMQAPVWFLELGNSAKLRLGFTELGNSANSDQLSLA